MKLSRKLIGLVLPCLICLSPVNPVLAQEAIEEEVLFEFEEYVVSASKRLQRIEEAPATITVITAEDIRQSGLTSIPEILRQVAGLDVVTITAFDTQVAIRGFLGRAVNLNVFNKTLVLINGRSVYEDFFGGTIWESLPIQLEDIERIEVVKGPGSVLYGANAFTGVINIITKSPDESSGGLVSVTGGQFNHYIGSLVYGGKVRDFGYRLSGGWESASQLEERDEDSEKVGRFMGLLNYKINESSEASLEGGISDGKGETLIIYPEVLLDFQMSHIKANYNYSGFKAQTFWRGGRFDMPLDAFIPPAGIMDFKGLTLEGILAGEDMEGRYYTYDIELQHSVNLAEIHTIMGGLNYRFFTLKSNYTEQEGLNTYAGFLQYEIKPISSVIFNLGVRVDYQDYIKNRTNYSPRGSLIFTPLKGHTIFLSAGKAFRNPTYIDLFADASILLSVPDILLPPDDIPLSVDIEAEGNRDLKPASIESYELGYRTTFFNKLRANLAIFYNRMHDLIHTFGEFPEDIPMPLPESLTIRSSNYLGLTESIGGEAGLEYKVTPWLTGFINYSYEEVYEDLIDEPRSRYLSSPKNKVNGGLRAALKNGFSANILIHYVDATKKEYALPNVLPPTWVLESLDPYILLTTRVSYKLLNDRLEVAVAGQNLLNDEHKEVGGGEEIPLRVFGNLSVRF